MDDAIPIAELPNLGPQSQQMLAAIGIRTLGELRRMGAVGAYCRARQAGTKASLNLLWALEGALTGLSWQEVAREHRTSLLLAVDEFERNKAVRRDTEVGCGKLPA